jgi:transmembrane sensor
MKHKQRNDYRDRIVDEASYWFTTLQDAEVSTEDRELFADWLLASAEHVREYLALANLHTGIGELSSAHGIDSLVETARKARAENVISLEESITRARFDESEPKIAVPADGARTPDGHTSRAPRFLALAAGVALLAFFCTWWLRPDPNAALYTTAIGEQKSFPLPDGSIVALNAVSRLRVRYTQAYRDIELLSGEALFTVAKNPRRPFRVLTNGSVILAVGTRFDVYHRHADTIVTVVEGTVEIEKSNDSRPIGPALTSAAVATTTRDKAKRGQNSGESLLPVRLSKDQRAHIEGSDKPITVSAVNAAIDTAWRERRLIFESRPLGEVVAEFNLYNQTPLEIADAALDEIQVSGSFDANDPRSFALFLEEAQLASSKINDHKIILLHPTKQ